MSFVLKRMFRVKLAIDLFTNKRVAIKFLRVSNPGISKHKALECLIKEIKILADCDHPNISKIIEASLDGVIVKEYPSPLSLVAAKEENAKSEAYPQSPLLSESDEDEEPVVEKVRRISSVCYYVMKLAEYGELFHFIEHTDRFSERLARTLYF